MQRLTITDAETIQAECEAASADHWRQLFRSDPDRYVRFANLWLTCRCLTSFWDFLYFGVYHQARKHYWPPLHKPIADGLQNWTIDEYGEPIPVNLQFVLVSREHCKTQMGIAYIAWNHARDDNFRTFIRSWTTPKANEILRAVRAVIESDTFADRFPWVRPKMKSGRRQPEMWGNDGLMLERSDVGVRVPSLEACGHDKDPTGGHFNLGYVDDWAVEESETSPVYQPELFSRFASDDNLITAGGHRLVHGTTWAKDGFLDTVRKREGVFADMRYKMVCMPCTFDAFHKPFTGRKIVLEPDRTTFTVSDNVFPKEAETLETCQAQITFQLLDLSDTVTETREVVWNDGWSFRVNRPIGPALGLPISYVIGNQKPIHPGKFTLDSMDEIPALESDDRCARKSLPQARIAQGSYIYGCQMELNPMSRDDLLFDDTLLKTIPLDEFKKIAKTVEGAWYRIADLASSKETGSHTSILEGLVADKVYVTHLFWGDFEPIILLLELFRGVIRLTREYGASFRFTQFEKAHIEHTLGQFLPLAERDPYDFFSKARGEAARYANAYLKEARDIRIRINTVSRGVAGKMDRIRDGISPPLEQGRIVLVDSCPNLDRLRKEVGEATLDMRIGNDVIDTLADLCTQLRPPKQDPGHKPVRGTYHEIIEQAALAATFSGNRKGWP